MDKQLKNTLIAIGFAAALLAVVLHLDAVGGAAAQLLGLMQPVLAGGVFAFVLNVPMSALETRMDALAQKCRPGKKPRSHRAAALLCTVVLLVLLLVLVGWVVIPQLISSIAAALGQLELAAPRLEELLQRFGLDDAWLSDLDITRLSGEWMQKLTSGVGTAGNLLMGTVSSVAGRAMGLMMAVVFMFYFLLGKEMLGRQACWLLRRLCPQQLEAHLLKAALRLQQTYASFLSGQCTEAVILGVLMFVAFTLFRLPYAGLIAVLTAVTSLIPYIGSFLSCGIGVVLILLVDPWQALLAFVVYQVVQFGENQFIYPRVVGTAVGLPPLYTILAVFLGGQLFGVVGMIFFIPLMATAYGLLKEAAERLPGRA